jgi:hypothetical protein
VREVLGVKVPCVLLETFITQIGARHNTTAITARRTLPVTEGKALHALTDVTSLIDKTLSRV